MGINGGHLPVVMSTSVLSSLPVGKVIKPKNGVGEEPPTWESSKGLEPTKSGLPNQLGSAWAGAGGSLPKRGPWAWGTGDQLGQGTPLGAQAWAISSAGARGSPGMVPLHLPPRLPSPPVKVCLGCWGCSGAKVWAASHSNCLLGGVPSQFWKAGHNGQNHLAPIINTSQWLPGLLGWPQCWVFPARLG